MEYAGANPPISVLSGAAEQYAELLTHESKVQKGDRHLEDFAFRSYKSPRTTTGKTVSLALLNR